MTASDDEWEEVTMVVQMNGVLDAQNVRDAIARGQFALRRGATEAPILQVGNGLYTGKWQSTVGTDIILRTDGTNPLEIISTSDRQLIAEKALLTAQNTGVANTSLPSAKAVPMNP